MDPQQVAYHAIGTSEAASIVVTVLFFAFIPLAVLNLKLTHYRFYAVLVISASFRVVGFAARSAYLSHFKPSLAGVYLAFTNAGFGVNIAVLCLVLFTWLKQADLRAFQPWERRLYPKVSLLLIPPIIAFGPVCGIIAAGLIYGAITPGALVSGNRLRRAASWGLLCVLIIYTALITRITLQALRRSREPAAPPRKAKQDSPTGTSQPRNMRLVAVLLCCALLLDLRASVAVAALYHPALIDNDHLYYSLIILPELMVLSILSIPTLMARIALVYPPVEQAPAATGPAKSKVLEPSPPAV